MRLTHSFSALKMYENCPKRYLHQRVLQEVQDEGGEASIYGVRVHESLEHRLQSNTKLPEESERYEPLCQTIESMGGEVFVEKQVALDDNLTPTSWESPNAWLRSILDVLVILDNKAVIMDWKTGKRRPDPTQLEIFALQIFKHFPDIREVTASFLWLKTMDIDTEIYTRDDTQEMWARLLARLQRIYNSLEEDNWPAKPSGLCRFCPCRHFCDDARL